MDLEYLSDPKVASSYLGGQLLSGHLALFLGAGVSMAEGMRSWYRLVRRVALEAGLDRHQTRQGLLSGDHHNFMLQVETKVGRERFTEFVEAALYRGVADHPRRFERSPLLQSIAGLVFGPEGLRIDPVISLNFDDVVERYFRWNGYPVRAVGSLPALRSTRACCVFHPHGYLPRDPSSARCTDLLFTRRAADQRIGVEGNRWRGLICQTLESKISLFLGMSEATARDWILSPILHDVANEVKLSRRTGFWAFGTPLAPSDRDFLIGYNIVPLEFGSHAEIADFLSQVPREASQSLRNAIDKIARKP